MESKASFYSILNMTVSFCKDGQFTELQMEQFYGVLTMSWSIALKLVSSLFLFIKSVLFYLGTCKCGMPAEINLSELTFENPVKYEKIKLSLRKLSSKWTSVKPADKRFGNKHLQIFENPQNFENWVKVLSRKLNFRKLQDDLKTKKTKKLKIEEICRNLSRMPETSKLKTQVDKDNNHIPNSAQRIISK